MGLNFEVFLQGFWGRRRGRAAGRRGSGSTTSTWRPSAGTRGRTRATTRRTTGAGTASTSPRRPTATSPRAGSTARSPTLPSSRPATTDRSKTRSVCDPLVRLHIWQADTHHIHTHTICTGDVKDSERGRTGRRTENVMVNLFRLIRWLVGDVL